MITQEVECPSCKHKHHVSLEIVELLSDRNRELERAFRDLFAICVRTVPLNKEQ